MRVRGRGWGRGVRVGARARARAKVMGCCKGVGEGEREQGEGCEGEDAEDRHTPMRTSVIICSRRLVALSSVELDNKLTPTSAPSAEMAWASLPGAG